jgi:hypothetical protein
VATACEILLEEHERQAVSLLLLRAEGLRASAEGS